MQRLFKSSLVVADARSLPFETGTFGAVTAVNILHEVINAMDGTDRQMQLHTVIAGMSRVLKRDGSLIIYDGFMPDDETKELLVRPADENAACLLKRFRDEYIARPASFEESSTQPGIFESDLTSVVTFLTKYSYLQGGEAWEGERKQLYPFTSLKEMVEVLQVNDLELNAIRFPESHTRRGLANLLARFTITKIQDGENYTVATFPACQMLLSAQKRSA